MQGASEEHIRATKTALNRLGWYTPDPAQGMHGDIDENFKDSFNVFHLLGFVVVFVSLLCLPPIVTWSRILG